MTSLLEEHGQGGVCDQTTGESYFSSFLICDPASGWVLETSGRSWAAKPVTGPRRHLQPHHDPAGTGRAPRPTSRPATTGTSAATRARPPSTPTSAWPPATPAWRTRPAVTPADLAAHLRDHGRRQAGISVCMHLRGFQNTTSSIITELPADPDRPLRAWVAPGQPCISVYVPVFPPHAVPAALAEPATWHAFEALRDWRETDDEALPRIREVFDPLEAELWAEADAIATQPDKHAAFVEDAWRRVVDATSD